MYKDIEIDTATDTRCKYMYTSATQSEPLARANTTDYDGPWNKNVLV